MVVMGPLPITNFGVATESPIDIGRPDPIVNVRSIGTSCRNTHRKVSPVQRSTATRAGLWLGPTVLAMGLVVSACGAAHKSSSGGVSSAAPPLIVCGQQVKVAASGPIVTDLSNSIEHRLSASKGFLLYLRLSSTCSRGNDMVVDPADSVSIVRSIAGNNGLPVFVVVRVVALPQTGFTISVRDGNLALGSATVSVTE